MVYSGVVQGVDARSVEIEVNAGHGDPQIVIVGLPDTAVKESKDRVHTAILNSGFIPHVGRTTVNLAPADIKKEGPCYDLPIAIGMLAAQDEIGSENLQSFGIVGELALSGEDRLVAVSGSDATLIRLAVDSAGALSEDLGAIDLSGSGVAVQSTGRIVAAVADGEPARAGA